MTKNIAPSCELDIHPASPDEVLAAHRSVHPYWGDGRTLEEHLRFRLASPSHSRATWYVGCVEQQVVVSLGSHPLQFQVHGEVMPGSAIGAVFTVPEHRQRGYAARLLDWVDRRASEAGIGISVLYSDVDPAYYARLGYLRCPANGGWRRLPLDNEIKRASPQRLVEFDVRHELDEVARLYAGYHGGWPISIVRDPAYWQGIVKRSADDRYFWLQAPQGARIGYARLKQHGSQLQLTDYALANHTDESLGDLYETLTVTASEWGVEKLGGWLPDTPIARRYFSISPRTTEITMVKPLAYKGPLSADTLAAVDRFCEIDHV